MLPIRNPMARLFFSTIVTYFSLIAVRYFFLASSENAQFSSKLESNALHSRQALTIYKEDIRKK